MKKLVIIMVFSSLPAFAKSSLFKTDITVMNGPSIQSMEVAKMDLDKAIKALASKEISTYKSLVKSAKLKLESVEKKLTYNSAFITSFRGKMVNYFSEELRDESDIRYEVMINETCYKGSIYSAKALLDKLTQTDAMDYDEMWYENPVIKDNNLFIDMVDGPNEYSETLKIKACK